MRLVLLVASAMVIAGFGAGRSPARCEGVYGVMWVCNAQAKAQPPTPASRFTERLLARWNGVIGNHGFPADEASCAPYGRSDSEAVFFCEWRIYNPTYGYRCRRAVLSTSFLEFSGAWIPCTGKFAPPKKGSA